MMWGNDEIVFFSYCKSCVWLYGTMKYENYGYNRENRVEIDWGNCGESWNGESESGDDLVKLK